MQMAYSGVVDQMDFHRHVHTAYAYIVQEFGELNRSTRGETTHLDLAPPFVFVQADCGRGRATVTVYTLTSSIACSMAWSPMQLQPYSTYIFVVTESMRLSWQDACARVPWLAPLQQFVYALIARSAVPPVWNKQKHKTCSLVCLRLLFVVVVVVRHLARAWSSRANELLARRYMYERAQCFCFFECLF